LNRADIEWLLAEYGFFDGSEEPYQQKSGLDLRGANLRMASLYGLPLSCIRGGLDEHDLSNATAEQAEKAAIHLEGANLHEAHLEGAYLYHAYLQRATDLGRGK
jgi:uncharacterized protein YjbI with pentapeptide repeats